MGGSDRVSCSSEGTSHRSDEESEDLPEDDGERDIDSRKSKPPTRASVVDGVFVSAKAKGRVLVRESDRENLRLGDAGLASSGGGWWRCAKQAVSDGRAGGSDRWIGQVPRRAYGVWTSAFIEAWTLAVLRESASPSGTGLGGSYGVDSVSSLVSHPSCSASSAVHTWSTKVRFGQEEDLSIKILLKARQLHVGPAHEPPPSIDLRKNIVNLAS